MAVKNILLFYKLVQNSVLRCLSPPAGGKDSAARCRRCCVSSVHRWSCRHWDPQGGEGNASRRNGRHGWNGRNGRHGLLTETCTDFSRRVAGRGHDLPLPFNLGKKKPAMLVVWKWSKRNGPCSLSSFHPPQCPIFYLYSWLKKMSTYCFKDKAPDHVTRESLNASSLHHQRLLGKVHLTYCCCMNVIVNMTGSE